MCYTKIGTEISRGESNNSKGSYECNHDEKTTTQSIRYEKNNSQTHYVYIVYDIKCTTCKEAIENYTEKTEKTHLISNNTCTKCGYVKPSETTKTEDNKVDSSINKNNITNTTSGIKKPTSTDSDKTDTTSK